MGGFFNTINPGGGGGGPEGVALLAEIMRGAGAAPLVVAGASPLDAASCLGAASNQLSIPLGTAVLARTADRAVDLIVTFPDVASPSGGVAYLGVFGALTNPSLCSIRCASGEVRLYHPQWTTNVGLGTFAAIRNKPAYIHLEYDVSETLFTAYVRIDGGAEATYTLAIGISSSSTAGPIHLGGNITNEAGVAGLRAHAFGLYAGHPGAEHRAAIAAALGW